MIATEEAEEVQVVDIAFNPPMSQVWYSKAATPLTQNSDSSESNRDAAGRARAATTRIHEGNRQVTPMQSIHRNVNFEL